MVNSAGADFSLDFKKLVKDVKAELKTIKVEYKVGVVPDQFKTRFKADVGEVLKSIRLEKYVDLKPNLRGFKTAFDDEKRKYFAAHPLTVNVKLVPDFKGFGIAVKKEAEKLSLQGIKIPVGFDPKLAELEAIKKRAALDKIELDIKIKETSFAKAKLQLEALEEKAKFRTADSLAKSFAKNVENVGVSASRSNKILGASVKDTANAFTLAERTSEGFSTSLATVAAATTSNIAQNRIMTGVLQKYLGVTAAAVPASIGFADALVAVGLAFKGIKAAGEFESIKVGIDNIIEAQQNLGKTNLSSNQFIKDLQSFAVRTPFEFKDLADLSKRLLGVGFAAEDSTKVLETLGNVVSVTGGDTTNIQGVVKAIGQIRGAGKLYAQDLNQLAQQLPGFNPYKELAKSIDVSEIKLRQLMKTGQAPAGEAAISSLLNAMEKFPGAAGAMDKQARTLLGTFSNFKDAVGIAFQKSFTDSIPAAITMLNVLKGQVQELLPDVGENIAKIFNIWADPALLIQVSNRWAKHFNMFLDMVAKVSSSAKGGLTGVMDGVLTFSEQFFRLVGEVGPTIFDLAGALGRLAVPLSKAFGDAALPVVKVWSSLLQAAVPIVDALARALDALPDSVVSVGLGFLLATRYTKQFGSTLRLLQIPNMIKLFSGLGNTVSSAAVGFKNFATSSDKSVKLFSGANSLLNNTRASFEKVGASAGLAKSGIDSAAKSAAGMADSAKVSAGAVSGLGSALGSIGVGLAITGGIALVTNTIERMGRASKENKARVEAFSKAIGEVRQQARQLGSQASVADFFDTIGDNLIKSETRISAILQNITNKTGETAGQAIRRLSSDTAQIDKEISSVQARVNKIFEEVKQRELQTGNPLLKGETISGDDLDALREVLGDKSLGDKFGRDTLSIKDAQKAVKDLGAELKKLADEEVKLAAIGAINSSFDKYNKVIKQGNDSTGKYVAAQKELRKIIAGINSGKIDESSGLVKSKAIIDRLTASNIIATKEIKNFILANGLVGKSQKEVAAAMKAAGVQIDDFAISWSDASDGAAADSSKISDAISKVGDSINSLSRYELPKDYLQNFLAVAAGSTDQNIIDQVLVDTEKYAGLLNVSSDELLNVASEYAKQTLDIKTKFIEGSLNVKDAFSFSAKSFEESQVSLNTLVSNMKTIQTKNREWFDDLLAIAKYGNGKYVEVVAYIESQGIGSSFKLTDELRKQLAAGNTVMADAIKSFVQNPTGVTPEQLKALTDAGIISAEENVKVINDQKKKIIDKLKPAFQIDWKSTVNGDNPFASSFAGTAVEQVSEQVKKIVNETVAPIEGAVESGEIEKRIATASTTIATQVKAGLEKGIGGNIDVSSIIGGKFKFAFDIQTVLQVSSGLLFGISVGQAIVGGVNLGMADLSQIISDNMNLGNVVAKNYSFLYFDTGNMLGRSLVNGMQVGLSNLATIVSNAFSAARPGLLGFSGAVNSIAKAVGAKFAINVPKFHTGGHVDAPKGSANLLAPRQGEVPAMLLKKEFVVSERGTRAFTRDELAAINSGDRSGFYKKLKSRKMGDGDGDVSLTKLVDKNFASIVNYNFGKYFEQIADAKKQMEGVSTLEDMFPKYGAKLFDMTDKFGKDTNLRANSAQLLPDGVALGGAGLGGAGSTIARLIAAVRSLGMPFQVTSSYRPSAVTATGNRSYHASGRAVDIVSSNMLQLARAIAEKFGGSLAELIHTPLGFYIKHGVKKSVASMASIVNRMHYNHIHLAAANGANLTKATRLLAGEAGVESVVPWTRPVQAIKILEDASRRGWTRKVSNILTNRQEPSADSSKIVELLDRIDSRVSNLEGRPVEINVASNASDNGVMAELLGRKIGRIL